MNKSQPEAEKVMRFSVWDIMPDDLARCRNDKEFILQAVVACFVKAWQDNTQTAIQFKPYISQDEINGWLKYYYPNRYVLKDGFIICKNEQ